MPHHGLGDAVSQQVADEDVDGEPEDGPEVSLPVAERETLVEEVTQDAPEEIVRGRREPVTQMEHIVEHEHDGRAEQRVHDSDKDKTIDSWVAGKSHDRQAISGGDCRR